MQRPHDRSAERALLDAIRREPEADEPRLVYADWLMERGDPRGEYIAIACTRSAPAAEAALLAKHGSHWLAALPRWLDASPADFERGFVARASFRGTLGDLVSRIDELVALAPVPVVSLSERRYPVGSRVLVRSDARVAGVSSVREDSPHAEAEVRGEAEGVQRLAIVELPSRRELAIAEHASWSTPTAACGHVQRMWFRSDRNALCYVHGGVGSTHRELEW